MQLSFDAAISIPKTAYDYGERASGEAHGVVLTKPHIVELILDLAGYTSDRDLRSVSLLEPSCGEGAFLLPAVDRLMHSAKRQGIESAQLHTVITAYDIDPRHVATTRAAVAAVLRRHGVSKKRAADLVVGWIVEGDFLLARAPREFDVVVGNPPYVRIEQLGVELQVEYRRRYASLYDRADLYVAFIERALQLLAPEGRLSFICADRWISNKYGAPLRRLVSEKYAVSCYVDLHTASPFESEVIAYPSIFVLGRGQAAPVHVVSLATGSPDECAAVPSALLGSKTRTPGVNVAVYPTWFEGDEPWVISSPAHLAALRELESRCLPLEADGRTRVGIGVATGNDKVYIVGADADVEPDRLVPLVMRDDIDRGHVRNAGTCVLNTFTEEGPVVDLRNYPRLSRYLKRHEADIKRRHVAQKNPTSWFRTIDRVYPSLVRIPKLLVPDIAGSNEVVYEDGKFHPHHNLYFITSEIWDLEVLGGLLSSRVALFFVWSYAVKMRGGYLRFQAQYLRRIRVPALSAVPPSLAKSIRHAFRKRDFARLDELAMRAYQIDTLPAFKFVDTRR